MHPNIQEKINQLKNDRLHGASWLSNQAIQILAQAIQETNTGTCPEFIHELKTVAAALAEARPSMASISNNIARLVQQIMPGLQGEKQFDQAKSAAQSKVSEFMKLAQEAPLKAAQNGARMVSDRDILITCSYSSIVCTTFTIAQEKAVRFEVIVAESRYSGTCYGEISAKELRLHHVPVTIIPDEAIKRHVRKANKALVGADTIGSDGSLINGIPTNRLAQAAASAGIPFYCVCETAKFELLTQRRKPLPLELGFERIPPDLITGIITETGIVKPGEAGTIRR